MRVVPGMAPGKGGGVGGGCFTLQLPLAKLFCFVVGIFLFLVLEGIDFAGHSFSFSRGRRSQWKLDPTKHACRIDRCPVCMAQNVTGATNSDM